VLYSDVSNGEREESYGTTIVQLEREICTCRKQRNHEKMQIGYAESRLTKLLQMLTYRKAHVPIRV